jgi:hypothetical protein
MKKQVTVLCQSKGGIGKSYAVWNFAYMYQSNEEVIFIDLDESTKTSSRLSALVGSHRISHYSLLDEHQKIERESFLNMMELFSKANYQKMYVDFGAAESEEFLKFLQFDFSAETLRYICQELGIDLRFNIILAGNDTLNACVNYSIQLTDVLKDYFPIKWMFNMGLSGGLSTREVGKQKIEAIVNQRYSNVQFITFGDLGFAASAKDIIQMLTHNRSINELTFASRLKFKEVMETFAKSLEI